MDNQYWKDLSPTEYMTYLSYLVSRTKKLNTISNLNELSVFILIKFFKFRFGGRNWQRRRKKRTPRGDVSQTNPVLFGVGWVGGGGEGGGCSWRCSKGNTLIFLEWSWKESYVLTRMLTLKHISDGNFMRTLDTHTDGFPKACCKKKVCCNLPHWRVLHAS
jgi:hypothetical protein